MAIKHHSNENFLDNNKLTFGTSDDLQLYHNGSNDRSYIYNGTGDLYIENDATDGDIKFFSDDGSGGTTTYLTLDGGSNEIKFYKTLSNQANVNLVMGGGQVKFNDSGRLYMGDSNDLQIYHDSSNSYLENKVGNLIIRQEANDADLILKCDDGSGGDTAYITLDGGLGYTTVQKQMNFSDGVVLALGASLDLQLFHESDNSYISNYIGDLTIRNLADDKDIVFQTDDGSGGVETYFYLDGSANGTTPLTVFPDHSQLSFGSGPDTYVYHNGSDFYLDNYTGNFYITAHGDDKDLILRSDDGSGGVTAYLTLDGSAGYTLANKDIYFGPGIRAYFGSGGLLSMVHDNSNGFIINSTGNLTIDQGASDGDIIFKGTDGGSDITALTLDMSDAGTALFNHNVNLPDSGQLNLGASGDLSLAHDGTDGYITEITGDLKITNSANDGDIIFSSDDGSGGVAEYIRIDGGQTRTEFAKATQHADNAIANFGSSSDMQIYHNGTDSYILNGTGDLEIINNTDDGDIIFKSDDGSGGTTAYLTLDGTWKEAKFSVDTKWLDSKKARFGGGDDLQIYHDTTDSIISNVTGDLVIRNLADDEDILLQSDDGSGGLATYITIDGSAEQTEFAKHTSHKDSVAAYFGDWLDLQIYHDGSNSYIKNGTGDLYIRQNTNDKDLILQCDDGSGGITAYLTLDGSAGYTTVQKNMQFGDGVYANFGASSDIEIAHVNDQSYIINNTGNLYITQNTNDGDVIFSSDDGSNGTTTYFQLDGSHTETVFSEDIRFADSKIAKFGASSDLQINHNGSHSYIAHGGTGNLYIQQNTDGADMIFTCDDGSGGATAYLTLDGSAEKILAHKGIDLTGSLTFTQSSAAFINHNVTSQSVKFRLSNSSALDVIPLEITPTYVVLDADLYVPSYIRHLGDSDTLIGFNATDQFIVQTGGSHRLTVTDDGVGIGASPSGGYGLNMGGHINMQANDIYGADNCQLLLGTSQDLQIYHDGTDNHIDASSALNLATGTSGVQVNIGHTTSEVVVNDNLTVTGDLTVSGTTTTVNQTNLDVADNIIGLNRGSASNTNDSGIIIERGDVGNNAALIWDEGDDHFVLGTTTSDASSTGGSIVVAGGNLKLGGLLLDGKSITGVDNQENFTNADDHIMTSAAIEDKILGYSYTANALPLAGGTMTGNIAHASDFTIDVGGDIILDADGAEVILADGGTQFANLKHNSGDFEIKSLVQDKDIKFIGNDNNSDVTALTLDMSEGGNATFIGNVQVQTGNSVGKFAVMSTSVHGSYDFYNNGTSYFNSAVTVDAALSVTAGALSITGDGSNAVTLTESGSGDFTIDAPDDIRLDAGGGDIVLRDDGTEYGRLSNSSADFVIQNTTSDKDILFKGNDGGSTITALTLDISDGGAASFAGSLTIPDYINHAGDSGTKFGFSADDTFVVTTGGTERFTVDSSGRANFAGNADVTGNVEARGYLQAFSTFYMRGTTQVMNKAADGFLSFLARDTSGSETVMNISNVGTLTTAGKIQTAGEVEGGSLDINGNADIAGNLTISGTTALDVTGNVDDNWAGRFENTNSGGYGILAKIAGTSSDEKVFEARVGGSTKMAITGDGNATFAGDVAMQQAGDVYLTLESTDASTAEEVAIKYSNQSTGSNYWWAGLNQSANYSLAYGDAYSGGNVKMEISTAGDTTFAGHIYLPGSKYIYSNSKGLIGATASQTEIYGINNILSFYAEGGGTKYMTISGGDVAIGTNNPTSLSSNTTSLSIDSTRTDLSGAVFFKANGTVQSQIYWGTSGLILENTADDADMIFKSDDGSGGTTAYITLDGSAGYTTVQKNMRFADGVEVELGTDGDMTVEHSGTNGFIHNQTGDLTIKTTHDDGDIIFQSDDGSGGTATYLTLDGGISSLIAYRDILLATDGANGNLKLGASQDLILNHDGTDSKIQNITGDLKIVNLADDKDILFQSDNGSGGDATYFRLDGSEVETRFHKSTLHYDNIKAKYGDSGDLEIYHDGSHSYIKDVGSGFLFIEADAALILQNSAGESYLTATSNGSVSVRYDNAVKLETASGGINVTGTVTAAKLSTDTVTIVEDAKTDTALMTLTGAGAGTEANVALKLSGTVHGNPIKMKMVSENASGNVTGAGMLSYEPDNDEFNIGQSTTHNRMGVSIGNTVTIGDSDIIYQEDVTIKSRAINMTANSSHYEFNGDIMKIGDDTTTRGKLYNYKNGTWTLADKDAEADADGLLAIAVGTNSTTHGMLLRGTMTLDYDPGGAGDVLYVGDSGVIQNSAPSGSGDIVRIVGYLLGGTHGNIFFDPDKTFVEVA